MSRPKFSKKWRELIAERADHRCEYCQIFRAYSPSPFDIEHIKALSQGGLSILRNLAYSCHGCNLCKSNKMHALDPETEEIVPLYNPRTSNWSDHFQWDEEEIKVIGLTSIGRATVRALQLNRVELVNLRTVLKSIGEHPPRM